MNKNQAAAFLEISVRDLERHMQKGRVPYHFERGKTRPRAAFNEADLEAFKKEIQASRFAPRPKTRTEPMERISFRLDQYHLNRLAEEAGKLGVSPEEVARQFVTRALDGTDQWSELKQDVSKLRRQLLQSVHAVLQHGGKLSETQATDFVKQITK